MRNGYTSLALGSVAVVNTTNDTKTTAELETYLSGKSVSRTFVSNEDAAGSYSTKVILANNTYSKANTIVSQHFPDKSWNDLGSEGYFLSVVKENGKNVVYILSSSEHGRFNGLQTFKQITATTNKLYVVDIFDKPSFDIRGIPLSLSNETVAQTWIANAANYKMNFMWCQGTCFNSKFGTNNWRTAFSNSEKTVLQTYLTSATNKFIDLTYSILPRGTSIPTEFSSESDINTVVDKMSTLYDLGQRDFGLSFDDLAATGEDQLLDSDDQTYFSNNLGAAHSYFTKEVYNRLAQQHSDISFNVIPMYYHTPHRYADTGTTYLQSFNSLPSGVGIYTTSYRDSDIARIVSDIGRPTLIWSNFYSDSISSSGENDYVVPFVDFLSWDNTTTNSNVTGFTSMIRNGLNAGTHAAISLRTLSDFMWNKDTYDEDQSFQLAAAQYAGVSDTVNPQVATPVISAHLNDRGATMVSIVSTTPDTTIYYTMNGSTPTTFSELYRGEFTVHENTTIKALAIRSGYTNSSVSEKTVGARRVLTEVSNPDRPVNCPEAFRYCSDIGPVAKTTESGFISGRGSMDQVQIYIPKEATSHDLHIEFKEVSLDDLSGTEKIAFPWAQGLNTASEIYKVTPLSAFNGYPIIEFDLPGIIVLPYDNAKLAKLKIPVQSLRIAVYDTSIKKWRVLEQGTVFDYEKQTIANSTTLYGYFAVVYKTSVYNNTYNVISQAKKTTPLKITQKKAGPKEVAEYVQYEGKRIAEDKQLRAEIKKNTDKAQSFVAAGIEKIKKML